MSTLTCVRTKHKPEQTYEEFKEARLQGFGASDMGSLLNEGDYSCKRRLFLERLGLMPEDDRLQHHVERGKFLESPVAGLYASRTGRNVREVGTAYIKEFPFMRANTDRLVWIDFTSGKEPLDPNKNGWGCLEIKCPGEHMFRKIKKEGLPLAYILQLQWQMFCYGTSWGTFAIYWADGHELLTFDVQRDDELIGTLVEAVKREWVNLQEMRNDIERGNVWHLSNYRPEALDQHSKACERCPMFEKCHSIAREDGKTVFREELAQHARDFLQSKAEMKELEDFQREMKEVFRQSFKASECDTIVAGGYKIRISERSRETVSSKVKEILDEKQAVTYIKQSNYEVIDVKEAK